MSYKRISPQPIVEGGTGKSTFTAYSVITAGTTATSAFQNVVGLGTAGFILTSSGAGALPVWATPAASSISITGDTGGALAGAAFTFTGGTTGLSFGGAVATQTLTFAGITANGGTVSLATDATASVINIGTGAGAKTVTLGSTNTTSTTNFQSGSGGINIPAFTEGALITSSAGKISTVTGTAGYILTANAPGASPSFQAPAASSISITGNTGGALVGSAFTFTGGTTGLAFNGAGTTETLGGTLVIANGGTNATSMTNTNGVNYFDGTRIVTTTVGTAGHILTSNGAGVAPTFQAGAGSSISITGDTGGPISSGSFTFAGGATGLSFNGVGTTFTTAFAGITANGGTVSLATDATSSTINIGTGAGVKTSTFGSTNTTSTTTVQSGTGALNVTSTNGALTTNSGTGTLGISTDAAATTVSLATGAGAKTVTLGSTNTTSTTNLQSGSGGIKIPAFAEGALVTSSSGVISTVTGTAGYVLTANAAGTAPSFQAAGGGGGGITWSVITADQTAAVNNGYICNKAGLLTITLPTTAAAGTLIAVTGINTATGWKIAQNASQQIHFGTANTTSGVGGSLASSATRDSIQIICVVANLEWNVLSSIGNITYV